MREKDRVLIAGGSGVVGSRLVRALLKDARKVRVLDTRYGELEGEKENQNLEFVGIGGNDIHGGMADRRVVEEVVNGADVVYHLALNWDGASWEHKLPLANLFDVNVRGTLNLLEAARSHRTKHFVFSSSVAVYGETETERPRPRGSNLSDVLSPVRSTGDCLQIGVRLRRPEGAEGWGQPPRR
jgi:nucleoside-diphosphate-sugar epimerase